MDAPAGAGQHGLYYYHFPTEPTTTYTPPPFTDMTMTAAANLFPQALHAPTSLELPPLYNTMTTPSMSSGLELFALPDYNNDSI
jgi:hypothetical protein